MSVRRGLHLGNEDGLRLGLRIGLLMVGQVGFFQRQWQDPESHTRQEREEKTID